MVAAASQLPLLPPEDRHRLKLFFAFKENLAALAAELNKAELNKALSRGAAEVTCQGRKPLESSKVAQAPEGRHSTPADSASPHCPLPIPHSPLDDEFTLQSWATQPEIAAHIDYRREEADHRRRQLALDELEAVLLKATDLIEKRRAATAVLRTLNRAGAAAQRTSRPRSSSRGAATVTCQGREPLEDDSDHQAPEGAHPAPYDWTSFANKNAKPPPEPIRRVQPAPDVQPGDIVFTAMRASLNLHEHPDNLPTLALLMAPGARVNKMTIVDLAGQAPKFHQTGAVSILPVGPQSAYTARRYLKSLYPPHFIFTLTKSPDGPHPNCWLISEIDEDPPPPEPPSEAKAPAQALPDTS